MANLRVNVIGYSCLSFFIKGCVDVEARTFPEISQPLIAISVATDSHLNVTFSYYHDVLVMEALSQDQITKLQVPILDKQITNFIQAFLIQKSEHWNILNESNSLASISIKVITDGILNILKNTRKLIFNLAETIFTKLDHQTVVGGDYGASSSNASHKADFAKHVSLVKLINKLIFARLLIYQLLRMTLILDWNFFLKVCILQLNNFFDLLFNFAPSWIWIHTLQILFMWSFSPKWLLPNNVDILSFDCF